MRDKRLMAWLFVIFLLPVTGLQVSANGLDIAILGGRVIDPETKLDAVRNIGIKDGKIVLIDDKPLQAKRVIEAHGRVVSPGFIDMHAHGQSIVSARMQAMDGVTTGLELEGGVLPVSDFYDQLAAEGRPINYGASVNWANARIATFLNKKPVAHISWFMKHFRHPTWQKEIATDDQLKTILEMVEEGLSEGGLGVGFLLGYAPGTGRKEYFQTVALAAKWNMPTFTHARFLSMIEPASSFEAIAEIIASAAGTGAHAHIVHLNSMSLRDIDDIGGMISKAQKLGLRITTEAYPYGAGSTGIGAAMFRGAKWQQRIGGVTAHNFDVGGKRLTEAELKTLQAEAPGTETVIHFLETSSSADRAVLDKSVLFPAGVIASDGMGWMLNGKHVPQTVWPMPEKAWSHPRSAGTYGRFFRRYVREEGMISLMEAITRVSYGPAKILEKAVPQMRRKGRLQVGADADIVVMDMAKVTDNATYEKPAQPSSGFDYVVVNGVVLVDDGELDTNVLPGRPIRNSVRKNQ